MQSATRTLGIAAATLTNPCSITCIFVNLDTNVHDNLLITTRAGKNVLFIFREIEVGKNEKGNLYHRDFPSTQTQNNQQKTNIKFFLSNE
jgi:hypothetical protein